MITCKRARDNKTKITITPSITDSVYSLAISSNAQILDTTLRSLFSTVRSLASIFRFLEATLVPVLSELVFLCHI